jgi:hypothetical protein
VPTPLGSFSYGTVCMSPLSALADTPNVAFVSLIDAVDGPPICLREPVLNVINFEQIYPRNAP